MKLSCVVLNCVVFKRVVLGSNLSRDTLLLFPSPSLPLLFITINFKYHCGF